jgi:hypothetical protein
VNQLVLFAAMLMLLLVNGPKCNGILIPIVQRGILKRMGLVTALPELSKRHSVAHLQRNGMQLEHWCAFPFVVGRILQRRPIRRAAHPKVFTQTVVLPAMPAGTVHSLTASLPCLPAMTPGKDSTTSSPAALHTTSLPSNPAGAGEADAPSRKQRAMDWPADPMLFDASLRCSLDAYSAQVESHSVMEKMARPSSAANCTRSLALGRSTRSVQHRSGGGGGQISGVVGVAQGGSCWETRLGFAAQLETALTRLALVPLQK